MDPGNLLYGTIVATAALAVGASRGETAADMTEAMATTLVVYWLAHIYIATVHERPSREVDSGLAWQPGFGVVARGRLHVRGGIPPGG
jgi:hypothetical protein